MSENIQSISQGTYTIGNTNELTFSAGPGIKVDQPSEGVVRIGNDETVLFDGLTNQITSTSSFNLTDDYNKYDYLKIFYYNSFGLSQPYACSVETFVDTTTETMDVAIPFTCGNSTANQSFDRNVIEFTSSSPASVTVYAAGSRLNITTTGSTMSPVPAADRGIRLRRIVGIGHKEV